MNLKSTKQCKRLLLNYKHSLDFKCKCGYRGEQLYLKNNEFGCRKCKRKYSLTNRTVFHNVRFGLLKAMRIAQEELNNSFSSSVIDISRHYKISTKTARFFLYKIRKNKKELESIFTYENVPISKTKSEKKDLKKLNDFYKKIVDEELKL